MPNPQVNPKDAALRFAFFFCFKFHETSNCTIKVDKNYRFPSFIIILFSHLPSRTNKSDWSIIIGFGRSIRRRTVDFRLSLFFNACLMQSAVYLIDM